MRPVRHALIDALEDRCERFEGEVEFLQQGMLLFGIRQCTPWCEDPNDRRPCPVCEPLRFAEWWMTLAYRPGRQRNRRTS